MKPSEFISGIAPAAQDSMQKTRIPASFVIAEGALESGWGSSQLTEKGLNLFGVKADPSWHGPTIEMRTREYLHGEWLMVPARWRKYSTWLECIDDHAWFLLNNPRYEKAFAHANDAVAFTRTIAAAGYATDPSYAGKIISIIHGHNLIQFDKVTKS
ncbi:MAG: glucosaminidase domain-containing protein [Pseudomonadota bacterium]|nr:glucosaminidase domain-containing protein [Pseudomonadota bacterium]